MKESKNDSTPVLARFGRDKRARMVKATAERVERRPRLQRDAADSEQTGYGHKEQRRASYNPHFTADNRPAFETPRRDGERTRRTYDDSGRFHFTADRGPSSDGDKPRRTYGDKSSYGGKKTLSGRYGAKFSPNREGRSYGERNDSGRPPHDEHHGYKGSRKYGDKPGKPASGKRTSTTSYPRYNPDRLTGEIRLNRFIAQSGVCSRREADDFILAGVVTVNGQVVTELGTKVLPTDDVRFNDQRLQGEKRVYLVLNKPKGYVTSLDDPHAGKTVMELVKGACAERIYPVGRLDKNSLGLLLFTNDGDLTKQLTHPSYRKKKIYQVTLDKPLMRADMDRIAEGITLEDGEIHADEISYVKENKQEVGIEIHSGRNRIVRRIFEFLGYTVTKLDRVYYAGLTKKNLKRGAWRFLTHEEVERLKSGFYE